MKNLYKIKDELYIIDNNEKVTQNGTWGKCSFTGDILKNRNGQYAYKVILTTNKLLIKDGVQAIDNEFLEWFVKNPSCESVEVKPYCEKLTCKNKDCNVCCQELKYKIIIPSEGFCDNCNNDICCCIIKKQETLEEAAERLYPKTIASIFTKRDKVDINKERRDIFIERDRKSVV